jgi:hypothetical protein
MNSEDKFKELLNEKLEGKEFPFNAAHWDKAQEMIEASRERKKRRATILWLLLLCTLGVSTYLVWNLPEDKGLAEAIAPKPTAGTNAASTKTDPAAANNTDNSPAAPSIENTSARLPAKATQALETAEKISPARQETTAERPNSPVAEKIKAPEGHRVEKTMDPADESTSPAVHQAKQKQKRQVPAIPAATLNNKNDVAVEQNNPGVVTPEGPVSEEKTPATTLEQPIEKPAETPPAESITAATPTSLPEQALPNAVETGSLTHGLVAEAPVTGKDTVVTVADAIEVMIPKLSYPKHLFFIEAGANYLAGWQASQKRDAAGFNPVAGIGYINNLTDNLSLSLGVNYTSVGHLGAYSHTSKISTLGLGEQSSVTVITPSKLHYLALPLRLTMAIDSKNSFGIGYTLAYLLTVDSKIETYDQATDYEQGGTIRSNYAVSTTQGYTKGFSAFDSQLSVLYRRRLYRELFVNTELLLGLTDLKDNKFFASNSFERSLGLKVTLMYNIFKK